MIYNVYIKKNKIKQLLAIVLFVFWKAIKIAGSAQKTGSVGLAETRVFLGLIYSEQKILAKDVLKISCFLINLVACDTLKPFFIRFLAIYTKAVFLRIFEFFVSQNSRQCIVHI